MRSPFDVTMPLPPPRTSSIAWIFDDTLGSSGCGANCAITSGVTLSAPRPLYPDADGGPFGGGWARREANGSGFGAVSANTNDDSRHSESVSHRVMPGTLLHLDVAAVLALERSLQLVEGAVLDLADPLAGQVVLVTDLAERALLVVAEPEPLRQHVGLDRRQVMKEARDLRGQRRRRHVVLGRVLLGVRIGHRLAEAAVVVIVDRPVEGHRLAHDVAVHLVQLRERNPRGLGQLLRRRRTAEL